MPVSWKSKIFPRSDIAGSRQRRTLIRIRRAADQISSSLTIKLIVLVGIFAALPIVLYGQFEKADRQTRNLVAESLRHHGWLVSQALAPILDRSDDLAGSELAASLERFSEDGTILKLMFQPKLKNGNEGFYFIAAAPKISASQMGADLDVLERHGILKSLADSCRWDKPVEIRYPQMNGTEEILTSIIPINGRRGCWVLVSANNSTAFLSTAFGRPYWQTDNVRMAALIYLVFAALALLVAIGIRRALRHFRKVAREIRRGGVGAMAFAGRNIPPELASAARDFDRLVDDLHRAASDIRRTAEDNAHAVKAPLAVIRSALQPLRRSVPKDDLRSQRAVQLIDSALGRLSSLISTAQQLGHDTADFIEAPKLRINLTEVVAEGLRNARDGAAEKRLRFVRRLDEDAFVLAPDGMLDIVVENILDNAASFSIDGGTITTILRKSRDMIDLTIDDEGPGVDTNKIEHIFERNFSCRSGQGRDPRAPAHAGLGLWIVRHHIEALGGRVSASNRPMGGLRIHICLPGHGW